MADDGKIARRIGLTLAGLVLAGCCFWSGLGAWLFAPLTPFLANRLSYSQGKAEVIAPAQWQPGGGKMSSDGRYMMLSWTKNGPREHFVWDLVTAKQYPSSINIDSMCWVDAEKFVVRDSASEKYYLVQAQNAVPRMATRINPREQFLQTKNLPVLQARWASADQIYVLENFGVSGDTVLTLEQGQPYVYRDFGTGGDSVTIVDQLTHDLPHVTIPSPCNHPPEGRDVYSPDGRYYYRLSMGDNAHILIYNRERELVAEAAKNGWTPRMLGWAHDSSGVYFQMLIAGGAASMLVPYQPIFKLSPLTPEEEQSALIWRIGTWAGGIGVVGGVGWWLWRRKRRRAG
jgi:hypothetical protein